MHLSEPLLRAALSAPPAPVPRSEELVASAIPAAVLLAVSLAEPAQTFAIVRSRALRDHAGEVAFPGGKRELSDADLRATALREASEEVGIAERDVTVLGALSPMPVITGRYLIHPFVGLLRAGALPRITSGEIAELLPLPLLPWIEGARPIRGVMGTWLGVSLMAPHFELGQHVLFGASGYVFYELLSRIAGAMGAMLPEAILQDDMPWKRALPGPKGST